MVCQGDVAIKQCPVGLHRWCDGRTLGINYQDYGAYEWLKKSITNRKNGNMSHYHVPQIIIYSIISVDRERQSMIECVLRRYTRWDSQT